MDRLFEIRRLLDEVPETFKVNEVIKTGYEALAQSVANLYEKTMAGINFAPAEEEISRLEKSAATLMKWVQEHLNTQAETNLPS